MPDKVPRDVVVFGVRQFASLVWYVLTYDSPLRVAGFTVDAPYITAESLHARPVVAFENVHERFPPDEYAMLIPLGGGGANALRVDKYLQAKEKGYTFVTYVSSRALVWPDLQIGENAMVFEGATIQPMASIGNNCIVRSQANVSHHARVDDHCFLANGAVVGGGARIQERCFLGLASVIRDGITVAPRCVIGAGAVVVSDTRQDGTYVGVPARRSSEEHRGASSV